MKLHLGCGRRHIPGYAHIDVVDHPHVDHVSSIHNLSFLQDRSVDLIYNCRVLEHFKRCEVAVIGPIFGRQDYLYNIHYNLFDFETLKPQLEQTRFCEARCYDWQHTERANVDDYSQAYIPHMDKERGVLKSLDVECRHSAT